MKNSDIKNRKKFFHYETRRKTLKSVCLNENLDLSFRWLANLKLSKLPRNSSICRIHNYCIETHRSRSVISHYKLSRLRLRKRASRGDIGLKKSSW